MKDRLGNTIKLGDTLLFKHPVASAVFTVIERNGVMGIENAGFFFPLSKTDIENAEVQK